MSDPKITIIDFETFSQYDYMHVASWYIMDSLQQYVYVHTKSRADAQKVIDDMYGVGKYLVKAAKISKGNGNLTCTGSNSRKGFASQLKRTV
jgi:hypothetical protein